MNRFLMSAAAGLAGGALGLLAMKYAQQGTQTALASWRTSDDEPASEGGQSEGMTGSDESAPDESRPDGAEWMSISGFQAREGENATGALARGVYERLWHAPLDEEREERLGNWVHRGYGESMAMGYSLFAFGRGWGVKGGALYGFALWAIGDELMVPLLGLSKKPTAYPAATHVSALAGHVAFGAALGAVVDVSERWAAHNA